MAPKPFLELPAEIRLNIYQFVHPLYGFMPAYKGLFLSCKTIYNEASVECSKTIHADINALKTEWAKKRNLNNQGIQIFVPHALLGLCSLKMSINVDDPVGFGMTGAWEEVAADIIALFASYHLDHLSINLYKKVGQRMYLPAWLHEGGASIVIKAHYSGYGECGGCDECGGRGTVCYLLQVNNRHPGPYFFWRPGMGDSFKEAMMRNLALKELSTGGDSKETFWLMLKRSPC